MSKYLLQISIGPVQDFIASARKLRDLWFGSELLSQLSKVVARSLNENQAQLIFPAINTANDLLETSPLIVANKILAEIEVGKPETLIKAAKKEWLAERDRIAIESIKKMHDLRIMVNEKLYYQQVGELGEFFAAWVELGKDYQKSRIQLEQLLVARKNLREFSAPCWDGVGLTKNSLDGIREAVTEKQEKKGLLKKNERLDAAGCIKRFYPLIHRKRYKDKFDDLSEIALQPFKKGFGDSEQAQHIIKFMQIIEPQYQPKDFKIANEKWIDAENFYLSKQQLQAHSCKAWTAYRKMTLQTAEPLKYGCILLGDGDNMGETLNQIKSASGHRIFSQELSLFAQTMKNTLITFSGSLIYAGGDDVMAYVPLHEAIACVDKVQTVFKQSMETIFHTLLLKGEQPTFSIGLVIVHHREPLEQALNLVRIAEQLAKKIKGKNALAMIQHKRGGSDIRVAGKWSIPDQAGIVDRFKAMCELYNTTQLSTTLAYQLRQIIIESGDKLQFRQGEKNKLIPKNVASSQILRVFSQKQYGDLLIPILVDQTSIRVLSDEMVIARQIAYAQKMSQGE